MTKKLVLEEKPLDYAELWTEWLDWAYNKENVMIVRNALCNTWVLRLIIEDKYWKKLKVWFKDFLYMEDDDPDVLDKKFFQSREDMLTSKDNLIVFKGTEKVYSILRYTYSSDPQREFVWIEHFLDINTEMKNRFLV